MTPLSPEAVEVQAPPDLSDLARYTGLSSLEIAAAKTDFHMSTCPLNVWECPDCAKELRQVRLYIVALWPVIEADARADERRKVVAELVETLEGVYVGDPQSSLYIAGKSDGYLEAAGTVRHHYDDSDVPPVAAASNPHRHPRPDTEGGVDR